MVKIRTFTERDRPVLHALFARARKGSPSDSLWGHDESEAAVYLRPYMDLEPGVPEAAVGGVLRPRSRRRRLGGPPAGTGRRRLP